MKKFLDFSESWIATIFGVSVFHSLHSIFDNDNSKIVSEEGKWILRNEEEMKEINKIITESEENSKYTEIII